MDYEEKYNMALETVQEILSSGADAIRIKTLKLRLQSVFPELKESEDERIRKELKHYLDVRRCLTTDNEEYITCNHFIDWLEKQSEVTKTSGQKLEPKFYPGDWIIDETGNIYQIEKAFKTIAKDIFGYTIVGGGYFNDNSNVRLWTIADAKDGDVLFHSDSASNGIFIFKEILQRGTIQKVVCYCDYDSEDGFCLGEKHTCCWTDSKILHPATKEQRDLLFQKMKEAGYQWDGEKKELKKIEQKPVDKVGPKFKVGNWYQCTKDFFGKGVTFDKNTAYYCANEGCLQDEYGCHIAIVKDLYDNFKLWTIQDAEDGDVLLEEETGEPFIYNGNRATYFLGYFLGAHCGVYNGEFNPLGNNYCWGKNSCPATNEQRDLLFQKMKDAGYEWDAERKGLKRIESKKLNADEVIE